MGPKCPPNLTHSTAHLTDKPYDVQLGVLKWIRGLLSEVVDEAASQLSTPSSIEPDQGTCGVNRPCVQEEGLVLPDAEERKENGRGRGQRDAGASLSSSGEGGESTREVSKAEPSSREEDGRAGMRTTEGEGAVITITAVDGGGGGGGAGVGRKRPRAPTQHGRSVFVLGDVVECFHADDGLWYPATITAIIVPPLEAPPPERAEPSEEAAAATEIKHEAPAAGAPWIEAEVPPSQLPEGQSAGSTLQPPLLPASECAIPSAVGAISVEGEGAVSSVPAEGVPAGGEEGKSRSFDAGVGPSKGGATAVVDEMWEARQRELLEVTFLGYGNQARVPHDWVREIVTPEVLEWCKDNGITAASAGAVEEACSPLVGGGATAAATDHVDGDALSDARAPAATVTTCAEEPDAPSCKAATGSAQVNGNEGQQRVAEEGGDAAAAAAAAGGSAGAERKQRKQQPRKRKKNANKNNKNNNNGNKNRNNSSGNNRRGAAGSRQVGTAEEEEERFLMRCASRSRSPYPQVPNKYWGQRFRYFSRFDEGVTMDEEGWYSVTPEAIARHIAERVCCDVVVDPFVGCGGNAVQFALVAHVVFAIDLDPVKLEHARRNAAIYGVENRIEFILGDAMKVLPTLKADAVFLSPPWGGPGYQDSKTFDLNSMIPPPLSALDMFRAAREVTPNVVFFLPRNVDAFQVAGLPAAAAAAAAATTAAAAASVISKSEGVEEAGAVPEAGVTDASFDDTCELEKHFLNGKLKTTAAYFGEDIAIAAEKREQAEGGTAGEGTGEGVAGVVVPAPGDAACPDGGWYGGDDKGKEATWSGRHVRFSEDGEGDGPVGREGGGVGVDGGGGGGGQDKPVSVSRKRENALYEAWMAT